MEWDAGNLILIAFSTCVAGAAFWYGWNENGDVFTLLVGVFFGLVPLVSISTEPGAVFAVFLGASPYIGYRLFQLTPAGRHRKAEQDRRKAQTDRRRMSELDRLEAQKRSREFKRLERIQNERAALAAAKKAAEQSLLDEIAREKTRQMNESLEWISVRTWAENGLAKGPTAERHRPLQHARRALEGGLFFDRADLSIEERLRIERKAAPIRARNASRLADWEASQQRKEERKRYSRSYRSPTPQPVHAPVGPRSDKSTWDREIELWSLYRAAGRSELELALKSVHSKCRRCGRPVSVQNKVDAMALVARTFELPEELYWRQAIVNTMWEHKRWKIEPSELLHSKIGPLSAAARHHTKWNNTVDSSDLNSPYPYLAYSQAGAEGLLANFWREGERYSEENWKAASKLAAVAPLIDDCLDCVAKAQQPQRSRVRLSPRDRETVLMRDGFRCRNCGRSPREDGIKLHVDHIEPWSKGGTNDLETLQALCEECNLGKRDQEIV